MGLGETGAAGSKGPGSSRQQEKDWGPSDSQVFQPEKGRMQLPSTEMGKVLGKQDLRGFQQPSSGPSKFPTSIRHQSTREHISLEFRDET